MRVTFDACDVCEEVIPSGIGLRNLDLKFAGTEFEMPVEICKAVCSTCRSEILESVGAAIRGLEHSGAWRKVI